jgi:small-conductance mechanosensitive channel
MNQTIGYFYDIGDVTIASLQRVWANFVLYLPQIVAAILVLIIGWIIAAAVGALVRRLIAFTGIDAVVNRTQLNERLRLTPRYALLSGMVGFIVKWLIIIATLMAVADILNLQQINVFLQQVLFYIPNAIVAVIILTIGVLAADFVKGIIMTALNASQLQIQGKERIASIAKYAIIVFSVMAALTQLGIVPDLIRILFGGMVLALALAFGLGGREEAGRFITSFRTGRNS